MFKKKTLPFDVFSFYQFYVPIGEASLGLGDFIFLGLVFFNNAILELKQISQHYYISRN
jgi:hypothetical protein